MGKVTPKDRAEIARLRAEVGRLMDERDAAQDDLRIADAERDEAKARIERCAPVADEGLAELVAYWMEQAEAWSGTDNYSEEADPEHADKCRQIVNTVTRLEGERDAALDALASCRKALEFIRTCAHYPIWVFRAQHWGLHERPDGYVQPHEVFCGLLSAAAQVPAEHLTGEEGEA